MLCEGGTWEAILLEIFAVTGLLYEEESIS